MEAVGSTPFWNISRDIKIKYTQKQRHKSWKTRPYVRNMATLQICTQKVLTVMSLQIVQTTRWDSREIQSSCNTFQPSVSLHNFHKVFMVYLHTFHAPRASGGRSQWPRGLKHELSSPAQTLGSWFRIPHKAWMSVCISTVFVMSCVEVAALRRADPPSKVSYRLCKKDQETEKAAKIQRRAVEP
jgi:hypothetical protein